MKCRIHLALVLAFLFIHGGCAPAKFQRTGSPGDFLETGRTTTALHGQPTTFVNISVGGQKTGTVLGAVMFGPVGWLPNAIASGSDRPVNQGILEALINHGLREYTQTSIAAAFSETIGGINRLKTPNDVFLTTSGYEAVSDKGTIPAAAEILAVDSFVAFYIAFSNYPSGATEGVVTELMIHVRYFSSGAERKTIWEDVFRCVLEPAPFGESLIENEASRAKQLVVTALNRLKPWIQREFQSNPYDNYPRIRITYKEKSAAIGGGAAVWTPGSVWNNIQYSRKEEGWLLQDRDNILVVRQLRGITMVLPREYVTMKFFD